MDQATSIGVEALGMRFSLVPLACLAILALVLLLLLGKRRLAAVAALWTLPFACILAFLALWCAKGLCSVDAALYVTACASAFVAACLGLLAKSVQHQSREPLSISRFGAAGPQIELPRGKHARQGEGGRALDYEIARQRAEAGVLRDEQGRSPRPRRAPALTALLAVLLLVAAAAFGVVALEMADNSAWFQIPPALLALECGLVFLLLAALYLLGQRHAGLAVLGVLACLLVGYAENFVVRFRGSPILPWDLYAMQTAASVADGYVYSLDANLCMALIPASLGVLALALVPYPLERARGKASRTAFNLVGSVLLVAVLAACVTIPSYKAVFRVTTDHFAPLEPYRANGMLASFIVYNQMRQLTPPEGYSEEAALQLERQLAGDYDARHAAQAATQQGVGADGQALFGTPDVVVIMNESYCDMLPFIGTDTGYAGPWAASDQARAEALASGMLAVPVHGGGTCNSEFEALTGNCLGAAGAVGLPFVEDRFDNVDSLARQFDDLGYQTTGIHPYEAANWSRDKRYAELGFQQACFMESFEHPEMYRTYVSDQSLYDFMLDKLRGARSPQFLFGVTVQNHGGYDSGVLPSDQVHAYTSVDYASNATAAQVNEFLTCLDESDRALQVFLGAINDLQRPVVVLFFGDYQPSMTFPMGKVLFPDQTELEESVRIHQAVYLMWANAAFAATAGVGAAGEAGVQDASASTLDALLVRAAGLPLTDYQKARLVLADSMPCLGRECYQGADGSWYAYDDEASPYFQQLQQLRTLNYLHFGARV